MRQKRLIVGGIGSRQLTKNEMRTEASSRRRSRHYDSKRRRCEADNYVCGGESEKERGGFGRQECLPHVPREFAYLSGRGLAVDSRTMRSAATLMVVGASLSAMMPSMRSMMSLAASRPISCGFCRIVVS